MRYGSRFRGMLAVGMAVLLCSTLCVPLAYAVTQDDVDQLQEEIDANQAEIDSIKDKTASNQEYLDALSEQLELATEKLQLTKQKIDDLNAQIAQQQEKIEDTYAQLAKRLRSMYMNGQTSPLEMLFSAQDYSTFLMSLELVSRTSKYDSEMIQEFKELIDQQEASKAELEKQRTEEEAEQQQMQEKVNAQQAVLAQLEADSDAAQQIRSQLEEQMELYEEEIRRQASSGSSGDGTYANGRFIWPIIDHPLGAGGYISEYFGNVPGRWHGGMDFTCNGALGQRLGAAGDGVVIYANSTDSWGDGWGHYVIIDHGDGLTTLYAHMDQVAVSVGQTVSAGDYIGTIGMTGSTYGPHCHLEVRHNGERVDPAPYFGY